MKEIEAEIGRYLADRAKLAALPVPGLSEGEVLAVEQFADDVRAGIAAAAPEDRRRVYNLLRLRGVVRVAGDNEPGVRLGRRLRRFAVDWDAIYAVQKRRTTLNVNSQPKLRLSNLRLSFSSPASGERIVAAPVDIGQHASSTDVIMITG